MKNNQKAAGYLVLAAVVCLLQPSSVWAGGSEQGSGSEQGTGKVAEASVELLAGSTAGRDEDDAAPDDESAGPGKDAHSSKATHGSRLSDERIPLQLEGFPQRPKPLLELGEPFLGTGTLKPGFQLPTGAVWQPSLLMFGTLRTAVQTIDQGQGEVSELAARLDLFFNLQLSGSERLVVGVRPLQQDGRFTRSVFSSDRAGVPTGAESEANLDVTSLFFEGDFGEIFPNLSREDHRATDLGFSIGRQPMFFQEGILINDEIDGVGITRNTLQPKGSSNFRATLFLAWNEVGRSGATNNLVDDDAQLIALLTSTDVRRSTVDADLAYVASDNGDLFSGGVSAVQRIGKANTAFRVLGSSASGNGAQFGTSGALLFSEISWTPHHTHDLFYINTFAAFDHFSSAARGPTTGGPLGRAGIGFAAVGLGSFGAPLSNDSRDVAGGAVGYQKFFEHNRSQIVFELASRIGTDELIEDAVALTARYQIAVGRRGVVVVDGFFGHRGSNRKLGTTSEDLLGARLEFLLKF